MSIKRNCFAADLVLQVRFDLETARARKLPLRGLILGEASVSLGRM
ncbi:hypothetical protein [Desulfomarina profundi]|nr:hypothetical protein [Desulfomarina profundi]